MNRGRADDMAAIRQILARASLMALAAVAIDFDSAGRVSDVRRYGLDDGREIQPVDRATPTKGREVTLLQQLFGNIGRFNDRTTNRK